MTEHIDHTTRLMENVIEITWMFDAMEEDGRIRPWDDIIDSSPAGSDAIKDFIIQIAIEFEEDYDGDENGRCDYLEKIQEFAERRLREEYGVDHTYSVMVTQSGYIDIEAKTPEEAIKIANAMPLSYFSWPKMERNTEVVDEEKIKTEYK